MRALLLLFLTIQLLCTAAPAPVEQQAAKLREILQQADDAYHNQHQSLMSNAAYDSLRSQYARIVDRYPELASPPPVGAPPSEIKNRVAHARPVLSLEKAYSNEDVENFLEKCGTNLLYCIEPKVDGLTIVLHYREGLLAQAITRGDGKAGIDVTAAILASGAVPAELTPAPAALTVRGEVLITLPAFEALNRRRIESGQNPLKSPRNTAAGTLRLKDFSEIANRKISIRIFELVQTDPMPETHTEALNFIRTVGLPTVESTTVSATNVLRSIADLNQRRAVYSYQTDGIVIRVDDHATFNQLGATTHHPRGALARKYREIPVATRLRSIEWTRGETGKLTPIGHFDPVDLQGATLQKATLHNLNYIRAIDLKLGDWIQVIRAGGSVPEIIGVCPDRRTGSETPIPSPPND